MLSREALLGSWMLERAWVMEGDRIVDPSPFGERPYGVIHYLSDGRVAVLIAHGNRPAIEGGRLDASDADRLAAARSFTGYGGTFTVEHDQVVHHVEVNSFPNDVGVDYVRLARLEDDTLELVTPFDLPADQRPMRLRWRRHMARG